MAVKKVEKVVKDNTLDLEEIKSFVFDFDAVFHRHANNTYDMTGVPLHIQSIYRSILRGEDMHYIMDNTKQYVDYTRELE